MIPKAISFEAVNISWILIVHLTLKQLTAVSKPAKKLHQSKLKTTTVHFINNINDGHGDRLRMGDLQLTALLIAVRLIKYDTRSQLAILSQAIRSQGCRISYNTNFPIIRIESDIVNSSVKTMRLRFLQMHFMQHDRLQIGILLNKCNITDLICDKLNLFLYVLEVILKIVCV